jgi:hypothetical protein
LFVTRQAVPITKNPLYQSLNDLVSGISREKVLLKSSFGSLVQILKSGSFAHTNKYALKNESGSRAVFYARKIYFIEHREKHITNDDREDLSSQNDQCSGWVYKVHPRDSKRLM